MSWAANFDRKSATQFLAECNAGWRKGDRFEYSILDPRARVIGSAGLMSRIAPSGLEIGYWVHAAHTQRGVATHVAAVLTNAALALNRVTHVEIHHDEANVASGRIATRLGFKFVGSGAREPSSPAEVGRELRWRMSAGEFATSRARALLVGDA
jgi:RimJ/RimL family protein N-acetyltransferase